MNWTGIKRKATITGISIAAVAFAFGVGTFNPNGFVTSDYTKKIESKFLKEAIALGMHEPDFVFACLCIVCYLCHLMQDDDDDDTVWTACCV